MSYVADIVYIEDLLEEFDLAPNNKIDELLGALEDADAENVGDDTGEEE
jgi:hypothetical protein